MSGYLGPSPVPQATQTRETFTATASQTSFATGGYQAGYIDVFLNGVKLVDGTDFTATNGSDVVLTTGAASGDTLEVVAYTAFEVLNQSFTGTTTVDVLDVTGNATFGDNDKAIFGAGSDLQIYHDGTHSRIVDAGTGNLNLQGDDLRLKTSDAAGTYLEANNGGAVTITYNSSPKLATTSTGIDVTGTVTATGGVYLGGTGAANKLDDYEEGTWTPTLTGTTANPTQSYQNQFGFYTKVGNMVHLTGWIYFNTSGISGGSGTLELSNLPFAITGSLQARGALSIAEQASFSTSGNGAPTTGFLLFGTTKINLQVYKNDGGKVSGVSVCQASDVQNSTRMAFTCTYTTSA